VKLIKSKQCLGTSQGLSHTLAGLVDKLLVIDITRKWNCVCGRAPSQSEEPPRIAQAPALTRAVICALTMNSEVGIFLVETTKSLDLWR
jgi:hypothetical protein